MGTASKNRIIMVRRDRRVMTMVLAKYSCEEGQKAMQKMVARFKCGNNERTKSIARQKKTECAEYTAWRYCNIYEEMSSHKRRNEGKKTLIEWK